MPSCIRPFHEAVNLRLSTEQLITLQWKHIHSKSYGRVTTGYQTQNQIQYIFNVYQIILSLTLKKNTSLTEKKYNNLHLNKKQLFYFKARNKNKMTDDSNWYNFLDLCPENEITILTHKEHWHISTNRHIIFPSPCSLLA